MGLIDEIIFSFLPKIGFIVISFLILFALAKYQKKIKNQILKLLALIGIIILSIILILFILSMFVS